MQGFSIWEHNMATEKKPEEKIAKNRLVEADVTEISLVPSGAVEDADYVVLHKEHEETEEPAEEDALAKAIETVSEGELTAEQAKSLYDLVSPLVDLEKEDTMEEEGTEDKVEGDIEKKCDCGEADCDSEGMEKSDDPAPTIVDRLAALEGRLQEFLEKTAPKEEEVVEEPEAELEKEDTDEPEDVLSRTFRIIQERELAKAEKADSEHQARFFAALNDLGSKLDSLSSVVGETDRKLARACGREA